MKIAQAPDDGRHHIAADGQRRAEADVLAACLMLHEL